jgi:hypothetical protein
MNLDTLRTLRETDATRTFSLPHELIDDPSLNASQKREILAEWASDACAIESFPTLRLLPGTTFPVTLSAIMDALASLDGEVRTGREEEEYTGKKAIAERTGRRALYPTDRGRREETARDLHMAY